MTGTFDIHATVTQHILDALETADVSNWQCPWHRTRGGLPRNALTGKSYRGINTVSLWVANQVHGYGDPRWATYRQWQELGAQVRKGEKSSLVVFYKDFQVDPSEEGDDGRRMVARASYAFNAAQVDGAEPLDTIPAGGFDPIQHAEDFSISSGIRIEHGGEAACYIPAQDLVRMPSRDRFVGADGYYGTLFHELVHATGHESRLNRDLTGRFKTRQYAAEELVAELGAAFLMAELGLEASEPHPQHAIYIKSWISLLQDDSRAVFTAASLASKAVDYLKGAGAP
ncbi:ArdC family protein [Microvirga sp. GCM10011540]|uniref:ArdC family protein n=1 Tax=Microvirga sp. GCM10011540 TaxID=3317338 RepID=UPI00361C8871